MAFNTAMSSANLLFLKWRVGLPEDYQIGVANSKMAYQVTQKITEDVLPFIVRTPIPESNGFYAIPADYFAYSSLRYHFTAQATDETPEQSEDYDIRIVPDEEFADRIGSVIRKPSFSRPIAEYTSYGLDVRPKGIQRVFLTYLRIPVTPVWMYNLVNDQPVFNATGSIDFEYPVSCFDDLAIMILKMMGVNLEKTELVQYSMARGEKGV